MISERRPGDTITDVLTRAFDEMVADYRSNEAEGRDPALMKTYARLTMSVPSLQAKALHLVFDLQREMAAALQETFADELDPITAAALVGRMGGAVQAAALASLERGDNEERFWNAMRCGLDTALNDLPALPTSSARERTRLTDAIKRAEEENPQ